MPDSSIGILDATGTARQVDAHTQPDGNFREAVVLGDAISVEVARVLTGTPAATDPGVVARLVGDALASAAPTATRTQVTASTTSVAVWPVRTTRRGGSLYNGSTGDAWITFGTSSVVATADVRIPPGALYELISSTNLRVTQAVSVIWPAAATGTLRCVEWA